MSSSSSTAAELSRIGRDLVAVSHSGDALGAIAQAEVDLQVLRTVVVCQLREGGASWSAVADQLGVSKQAAMKRYAEAADRHHRKVMRQLRDEVRATMPAATEVATEQQLPAPLVARVTAGTGLSATCARCSSTYSAAHGWAARGDVVCYVCQRDLAGISDGPAVDFDDPRLVDARELWAAMAAAVAMLAANPDTGCSCRQREVDESEGDAPVVLPLRGAHGVECPECRVEAGEPCRVSPCGHYTRGHRPHGRRVRLANREGVAA